MEGRLDSRREEVRQRRKTLRQSVLDERRRTGLVSNEVTPDPDDNLVPRLRTRAAIRAVDVRSEAARQLKEWKTRKAITAKEVQKTRPPFNNYVKVKHTGLSPFRSFQDASKRSRVAPWRAPPPKLQAQPVTATTKGNAVRQKNRDATSIQPAQGESSKQPSSHLPVPNCNVAAGVVQFGIMPHTMAKSGFKPPAKIQPIPFATRSTKAQATKTGAEKEKLKVVPKNAPVKRFSPKNLKKQSPKTRLVKNLVVSKVPVKQPTPALIEPRKTTRVATVKPRGMKKQLSEMDGNVEVKQRPKRASRRTVLPSTRVLRSSQTSSLPEKENLLPDLPTKVLAKVSKRRTKNTAGPNDGAPPEVPIIDDRTKGLEERSARLAGETDRLKCLADEWSSLKAALSLPTSIADEIDSVTGQTMLLTSKKFNQFKGLIEGAYTNMRTTLEDLDGFWEMMYIQVKQLDARYKTLNTMKEKNWNTNSPKLFKNVQIRGKLPSKSAKNKRSFGKSNFQKFLADKLKRKTDSSGGTSNEPPSDNLENICPRVVESPLLNMSVDGDFESPFHSFNATGRSGTPRSTPRVLENTQRASRSIRFSNTMMRLSATCQDYQDFPTS